MAGPYTPGGPAPYPSQITGGPPRIQTPDARDADLGALSKIWIAALASLVGSVAGIAASVGFVSTVYYVLTHLASRSALSLSVAVLAIVLGLTVAGFAITIVAFWFFRMGFLEVRRVDNGFYRSPTWPLVGIFGLILLALGVVVILFVFGGFWGGVALVLIGAILLLIGYIGMMVAIWRLGNRYGDSLFKIGAVLLIIPGVALVGQILVLLAASNTQTRLRRRSGVGFAAAPPMLTPPPPPPR